MIRPIFFIISKQILQNIPKLRNQQVFENNIHYRLSFNFRAMYFCASASVFKTSMYCKSKNFSRKVLTRRIQ